MSKFALLARHPKVKELKSISVQISKRPALHAARTSLFYWFFNQKRFFMWTFLKEKYFHLVFWNILASDKLENKIRLWLFNSDLESCLFSFVLFCSLMNKVVHSSVLSRKNIFHFSFNIWFVTSSTNNPFDENISTSKAKVLLRTIACTFVVYITNRDSKKITEVFNVWSEESSNNLQWNNSELTLMSNA